ncbi:uncharacterized protein LOC142329879 [Lycorma delicatula]|uniref:uncharacterized protein LOC142329879 n=1 Tax=Lycorma delicatula TaxID=130591 RepID=UPI003F51089C
MVKLAVHNCCGYSLKTGSIIIAWSSFISSIIVLLSAIFVVEEELEKTLQNNPNEITVALPVAFVIIILYGAFVFGNITFIFGVHKEHRGYILVWIITDTIFRIIHIPIVLYFLIKNEFHLYYIPLILYPVIHTYILMVVYQYYWILKDEESTNLV